MNSYKQILLIISVNVFSITQAQLRDKLDAFSRSLNVLSDQLIAQLSEEGQKKEEVLPQVMVPAKGLGFSEFYLKSVAPIVQSIGRERESIDASFAEVKAKISAQQITDFDLIYLIEDINASCNYGLLNQFAFLYTPDMPKSDRDDLIMGIDTIMDAYIGLVDQIAKISCNRLTDKIKNSCERVKGEAQFYSILYQNIKLVIRPIIQKDDYASINSAYERIASQFTRIFSDNKTSLWNKLVVQLDFMMSANGLKKPKITAEQIQKIYSDVRNAANELIDNLNKFELDVMLAFNTYMFLRGSKGSNVFSKIKPVSNNLKNKLDAMGERLEAYKHTVISGGLLAKAEDMKVKINGKEVGFYTAYNGIIKDIYAAYVHIIKCADRGIITYDPMIGPD